MTRINFDLDEERVAEIGTLADKIGAKTRVQLFNQALTLLEWYIRERETGKAVGSMDFSTEKFNEILLAGTSVSKKVKQDRSSEVQVQSPILDTSIAGELIPLEGLAGKGKSLRARGEMEKVKAWRAVLARKAPQKTKFEPAVVEIIGEVFHLSPFPISPEEMVEKSRKNPSNVIMISSGSDKIFFVKTEETQRIQIDPRDSAATKQDQTASKQKKE